jgi:adenylate kinase
VKLLKAGIEVMVTRMRLIMIGPPGSGKGTQAKLLGQRMNLIHISTGDILRDAVAKDTPEGRRAKPFMSAGQLVSDEIVNDIVNARFQRKDKPVHFIMDGYPRTLAQAMSFDKVLEEAALPLTAAVLLNVEDEEIVRRLGGRWTCPDAACMAIYHTITQPPKVAGVCDLCGTALIQREDDKPQTIRKRLQVFHASHDDILRHYRKQGVLMEVLGQGDVETINANIIKGLTQKSIA